VQPKSTNIVFAKTKPILDCATTLGWTMIEKDVRLRDLDACGGAVAHRRRSPVAVASHGTFTTTACANFKRTSTPTECQAQVASLSRQSYKHDCRGYVARHQLGRGCAVRQNMTLTEPQSNSGLRVPGFITCRDMYRWSRHLLDDFCPAISQYFESSHQYIVSALLLELFFSMLLPSR
jgi:hypothetical protein